RTSHPSPTKSRDPAAASTPRANGADSTSSRYPLPPRTLAASDDGSEGARAAEHRTSTVVVGAAARHVRREQARGTSVGASRRGTRHPARPPDARSGVAIGVRGAGAADRTRSTGTTAVGGGLGAVLDSVVARRFVTHATGADAARAIPGVGAGAPRCALHAIAAAIRVRLGAVHHLVEAGRHSAQPIGTDATRAIRGRPARLARTALAAGRAAAVGRRLLAVLHAVRARWLVASTVGADTRRAIAGVPAALAARAGWA